MLAVFDCHPHTILFSCSPSHFALSAGLYFVRCTATETSYPKRLNSVFATSDFNLALNSMSDAAVGIWLGCACVYFMQIYFCLLFALYSLRLSSPILNIIIRKVLWVNCILILCFSLLCNCSVHLLWVFIVSVCSVGCPISCPGLAETLKLTQW